MLAVLIETEEGRTLWFIEIQYDTKDYLLGLRELCKEKLRSSKLVTGGWTFWLIEVLYAIKRGDLRVIGSLYAKKSKFYLINEKGIRQTFWLMLLI